MSMGLNVKTSKPKQAARQALSHAAHTHHTSALSMGTVHATVHHAQAWSSHAL
jgi:hypothetical protein